MKYNSLKKMILSFCLILLCIALLMGCEETGEGIRSPSIGKLSFKTYVKDPITFDVYINDDLIGEKKEFKHYSRTVRLKVVEIVSKRVIFDGNYPLRPNQGGQVIITVWQESLGSLPYCIIPPSDEPASPEGYGKISIVYNLPQLPDSMKAVVENTTTATAPTADQYVYKPTDSLILRKNEFSRFFLSRYGTPKKARVKLFTASGERKQIGMMEGYFSDMSQDISQYISTGTSGSTILSVTMERIY